MLIKFPWQHMLRYEAPNDGGAGVVPAPAASTPVAAAPEPAPAPAPEPAPAPAPAAPAEPMISQEVFQRRISQLTAQKAEAEARAAELAARQAQQPTPPAEGGAPVPPQDLEAEVNRRAMQLADAQSFNAKANNINSAGVTKYQDFGQSVVAINSTFGNMPRDFIEQVAAAGGNDAEAADIIYHLGKDLNAAGRLLTLSPSARAVEIVKYASDLRTKARPAPVVSQAPAPITPVVGNGGTTSAPKDLSDPKLPIEEFVRIRKEQRAAQGKRRR